VRNFPIGGVTLTQDSPCYVIAELGHNHGGSFETAARLIDAAADAGAHAVKLQCRDNATLYSGTLLRQTYDNENSYGPTYGAHRAALELSDTELGRLQTHAADRDVACFATAFDERSADRLMALDVPAFKIASGGLTDIGLLYYVAGFGKPIILSTGGGTLWDIDRAVETVTSRGAPLALLHCTASYPCAFEELNLRCIPTLLETYPDLVIGWSCHVHNISMAMQAHAYGARIIETHFTLNRSMKGTDHAFSMEPATLTKLCKDLGRAHVAAGDGVKRYYESERKPIAKMRRRFTDEGWRITGEVDAIG
jgi:sialic acid synthase